MKHHFFLVVPVFAACFAGAQTHIDPAQVVDQFFPASFSDPRVSADYRLQNQECFAVYDQLPDGTPKTIMAGYVSGLESSISVIQRQPSGNYQVIYQPSGLTMDSAGCSVELHDVDGDGVQEVWYRFGGQRGEGNWVFKWDGSQLVNIGPTSSNSRIGTWTQISNGMLLDVYHDGTQQILSTDATTGMPDLPDRLYRLSNGQYVLDSTLVTAFTFSRATGKPQTDLWPFNVIGPSTGPYVLKITNGDRGGAHRVTSGHILMNGIQTFGPSDFSQQVEFLSAPLTNIQPGENTLSVELEGAPGSHLVVMIQDQTPKLQSAQ